MVLSQSLSTEIYIMGNLNNQPGGLFFKIGFRGVGGTYSGAMLTESFTAILIIVISHFKMVI